MDPARTGRVERLLIGVLSMVGTLGLVLLRAARLTTSLGTFERIAAPAMASSSLVSQLSSDVIPLIVAT
jgi:hypothetical protein